MMNAFWKMMGFLCLPVLLMGQERLPLSVERLSDRLVVIQTETGNSNVAVLASKIGLVMLDAGFSPSFAEEVMTVAQETFQRDDWYGLIHTNSEMLNAGGNAVFVHKHIIAHEAVSRYLFEKKDDMTNYLQTRAQAFRDRVERSQKQLEDLEEGSERACFLREWIRLCKRVAIDFELGYNVLLPTITFQNQMTLNLGDMTVHLYYFGKTPGDGQVLVWVPEEHFLWLADVFVAYHILPYGTYGPEGVDVTPWLRVLDALLDDDHEIRFIYRTQGKNKWTRQTLASQRDFFSKLAQKVHDADSQGLSLQQTLNQLCQYEETFPEILDWEREIHSGIVRGDIANVVTGLWKVNHTSAADTLFLVLTEYDPDAANKLLESIQINPDDYYILENEFNALGYRLLRMEKKAEALAMFRIMVSFYPESANAYDSLGEAYLALDDHENAILNYCKSLELGPENQNAREVLKRLKGE